MSLSDREVVWVYSFYWVRKPSLTRKGGNINYFFICSIITRTDLPSREMMIKMEELLSKMKDGSSIQISKNSRLVKIKGGE